MTTETDHVHTPAAPGFAGPDAPLEEDLYKCVHCGLCLQVCPTYVELGVETESPRGRIALMKGVHQGRIGLTDGVAGHLDLCLQCRACEAACPAGVPYGRMMEAARTQMATHRPRSLRYRLGIFFGLRLLLHHPLLLRTVAWALKAYQRSGLQRLVRGTGLLRPVGALDRLERQLPRLGRFYKRPRKPVVPRGAAARRVGMLDGCVMPLVYGRVNEATADVLARNGCEVVVPKQGCCGALSTHLGERDSGRALARGNIDAFLDAGVDAIVVNSAGCGSTMKEYAELLKDDPVYREKAERFAAMVQDVHEFLDALPIDPPTGETPSRVTYQDSCHLAHAQGVADAPRRLLNAIPGVKLVEMERSDLCCGAAGVYNVTHRDMSDQLLDNKMRHAAATAADVIATANPGCMLQLESGARERGLPLRVVHVVELLAASYAAETIPENG